MSPSYTNRSMTNGKNKSSMGIAPSWEIKGHSYYKVDWIVFFEWE